LQLQPNIACDSQKPFIHKKSMTLPNRPDYVVAAPRKTTPNLPQEIHLPHPPHDFVAHTPHPPAQFTELLNHGLPPGASQDAPFASLFDSQDTSVYSEPNTIVDNSGLNASTENSRKRKSSKNSEHAESYTPEEVALKRNYIKAHRLLPNILQVITETKRESMLPAVNLNSIDHLLNPLHGITNDPTCMLDKETAFIIVEEFLGTQGIETTAPDTREQAKIEERQQFVYVLDQLKGTFRDEVERLDRVCNDFCYSILQTLKDQVSFRCVSEEEVHLKIATIRSKFIHTKNKLCHSVFRTILALHVQHNQVRKKNKTLPKKATEILIQWFFDHINDPYPDENEKAAIGVACRLTLTQVHNWFGNKRIRYKHKCMEEENKRSTRKSKKVIEPKVVQQ